VSRHLLLTFALALATVAGSLAAGQHRRAALVGALSSGVTALASMLFMRRGARARKPLQAALLVMVVMFLVRIVVVALATVAVARSTGNVVAFIVAFFVPYFTYTAIEGSYLHSLSRGPGPTA